MAPKKKTEPKTEKNSKKKPTSSTKPKVTVDSRAQLVDAALRIILERGIDAVRIDDIVAEVGVTKGSLYWHFADREALVKEALAEYIRRENAATVAAVSEAITESTSKDDYLARIAPYIVNPYDKDQVEQRWQRLSILVETRKDPELAAMMTDLMSRSLAVYEELMRSAHENGILRAELDPKAVAVALNVINTGSNIISVLGDDAPDETAWWSLISFFIAALFPPEEMQRRTD